MIDRSDRRTWIYLGRSLLILAGVFILVWFVLLPALNLLPGNDYSALDEANELNQLGNLGSALILYTNAINDGKDLTSAYAGRGSTFMKLRRFREAIEDFTKSLNLERSADVLSNRCNAYRLTSSLLLAQQDCVDAIALDDENVSAHIAFAMLFVEEEQLAKARDEVNIAIEIDPFAAEAMFVLSQIEMAVGNTNAAVEALTKCIEIDITDPICYWHRGFLYSSLGKIDEAIQDMGVVLDNGDPEVHGQLMLEAGTLMRQYGTDPDQ